MTRLSDSVVLLSGPDQAQAVWTYFIADGPVTGDDPATLWRDQNGIVLFTVLGIRAAASEATAAALRRALGVPARSAAPWRMVAWCADPAAPGDVTALYGSQSAPGIFSIRKTWTAAWGDFRLSVHPALTLHCESIDGLPALRLLAKPEDVGLIQFGVGGQPLRVGYAKGGFDIPIRLAGQGAGSLRIAVGLDPSVLIAGFRCGFAYGLGDATLFIPMVPARLRTVDRMRPFDLWLNPIRPLDCTCTRFSVDDSGRLADPGFAPVAVTADAPDPLDAPYFITTTGDAVTLRPLDPGSAEADAIAGGFAFSVGPSLAGRPGGLYLSPCGLWVAKDAMPLLRLMAGVFGNEFLLLRPGDRLLFQPNQPAAASTLGQAPDGGDTPMLAGSCTTSWASVAPTTATPPAYFGQPSASSFFGSPDREPFPPALDVQLAAFEDISPAFPLVPYGGVFAPVPSDRYTSYPPPYAGTPDSLLEFEARVLADTRHGILAQSRQGPVFLPEGATQPNPSLDRAVTPQGLLFDLGPDGTANRLTLARSPLYPGVSDLFLRITAPTGEVLPPSLANVLTRDQAFLVVSTLPPDMGDARFDNLLDLAGFNLQFDVGDTGGTILVFKFNTRQSLKTLAATPSAWADAPRFNQDPALTSRRLVDLIAAAPTVAAADTAPQAAEAAGAGERVDSFATFNALADVPEWTGVLAFDVQIDGNGMPPGLQMLLGGIKGDLRAHHLGIQANRFTPGPAGEPSLTLADSALFGVIAYDAPDATAVPASFPDYEVEHLRIAWSNSRVVQSDISIGVTFDTLFGRKIWLRNPLTAADGASPAPPNTLQIAGTSQTVDGIDTVTFTTTRPFFFDFQDPARTADAVRVVQSVEVTRARLLPTGQPTPLGPATVGLHLLMDGQVVFTPDPFPASATKAAGGLDLFSYGTSDGTGMAFEGLAVEIAFALDPEHGSMVDGSKTTLLREDLLQPVPVAAALRPGSLLASFPAQISGFVAAPAGLAAAVPGATPIHIAALETAPPASTGAPLWALEYDIHLGSLGALSDDHAGLAAKLFIGWGPSAAAPDADAAGLFMQLPHLSGGVAGFSLQGVLKTQFGDGNLLRADLSGGPVYGLMFGNVQLSFLGYNVPPHMMVDFTIFAGGSGPARAANNLAWFLAARQTP